MTGACGLLGAHLLESLSHRHEVVGTDRHPWWGDIPRKVFQGDLLDSRFLQELLVRTAPQMLFHCAALTDVDACEKDPEAVRAYNVGVPHALAGLLPAGCRFIYVSTDAVLGGTRSSAKEEEIPAPRSAYGRSKWEAEQLIRRERDHSLVVRTNFYGWSSGRKKTFAEWLWKALQQKEPIALFDDFFFTPLYVVDFVERLIRLAEGPAGGLFHLGGGDRVSKYRFGQLLAEEGGLPFGLVRRGSLDQAGLGAPRAKDISLDSSKFQTATGMDLPGCAAGIRRFLAHRETPLSRRFSEC